MKTLDLNQLEEIEAGGFFSSFVGGLCLAWGAAGAVAQVTAWSNPITGTAATVLTIGCLTATAAGVYEGVVNN